MVVVGENRPRGYPDVTASPPGCCPCDGDMIVHKLRYDPHACFRRFSLYQSLVFLQSAHFWPSGSTSRRKQ